MGRVFVAFALCASLKRKAYIHAHNLVGIELHASRLGLQTACLLGAGILLRAFPAPRRETPPKSLMRGTEALAPPIKRSPRRGAGGVFSRLTCVSADPYFRRLQWNFNFSVTGTSLFPSKNSFSSRGALPWGKPWEVGRIS